MQRPDALNASGRAAFSLAELMVVIVILGLLATLVVPNVLDRFRWAQRETAELDIRQLEDATTHYRITHNGRAPDQLVDMELDHDLRDPWDTDYAYEPKAPETPARPWIASYAADQAPGGEGWDADIVNVTMDED